MDASLQSKLIAGLDALEEGVPIEQVLADYPEEAERLRPLLETAHMLEQFSLQPTLAAQAKSRTAFLEQAAIIRQAPGSTRPRFLGLSRLLLPLATFVFIMVLGAGLFRASASALPGQTLYGTKRLFERVQLSFTSGGDSETSLIERFNRERIREIELLLAAGRTADVEFEGVIEHIGTDSWLIADLETRVDDRTQIVGDVREGDLVFVAAQTRSGALLATSITLLGAESDIPVISTPDSLPMATVEPSQDVKPVLPTPTATTEPTPTASADSEDADDTPAPAATATPEATSEPGATAPSDPTATDDPTTSSSPSADATPAPTGDSDDNDNDDDDDDNGDGGSDDNGDGANDNDDSDSNNDNDDDSDDSDDNDDNDNDDSDNDNDDDSDDDDSDDDDDEEEEEEEDDDSSGRGS